MDVSKLTLQDADQLAEMKRVKAPLGVIHPLHTSAKRPPYSRTPDLTITATTVKPGPKPQVRPANSEFTDEPVAQRSPKRPPEGHLAPKNFMPGFQKPKSAKQPRGMKNLLGQILYELPLQIKKQALHRKVSILTKKDTRQSTEEYLAKVRKNLNKKVQKRRLREDVRQEGGQVMAQLDQAFTKLAISEGQYHAARSELEGLVEAIESQLWKEKTLSRFMHKTQVGEVTLQKLKRLLGGQQMEREGILLAMQKFVYELKRWKSQQVDLNQTLVFSLADLEVYLQDNLHRLLPEDRTGISYFLERMQKHLQRLSVLKPVEILPAAGLEKIVEETFVKWDGERLILEGVIRDIEAALEQEKKIREDVKLGKGGADLELKIVAEFVNQYFDKLEENIRRKKEGIEQILEKLKSGQEKPEVWANMIRTLREQVENEELEQEWKELNRESEILKSSKKPHKALKSGSRSSPIQAKTNIGRGAIRFTEDTKAKERETDRERPATAEKQDYRGSTSLKNPLDLTTSSVSSESDDVISLLNNPARKETELNAREEKPKPSQSPRPGSAFPQAAAPTRLSPIAEKAEPVTRPGEAKAAGGKSLLGGLLKKPTEEDTKLAELRALKELSPFQSLEEIIPKRKPMSSTDFQARLQEIELKRGTRRGVRVEEKAVETDKTRSQLIESGEREFSAYMDEAGQQYDPEERFRQERESMRNHIDPRYVEEMLKRTPDSTSTWYIRPHHLKSVTYHPYSIEDNPAPLRYQNTFDPPPPASGTEDLRGSAVGYLEKTVEDLKCELEERRRRQEVERMPTTGSYLGWVGKAVEAMNP